MSGYCFYCESIRIPALEAHRKEIKKQLGASNGDCCMLAGLSYRKKVDRYCIKCKRFFCQHHGDVKIKVCNECLKL